MFCTYDWLPSLDIIDVTSVQNLDPFLNMVSSSIKETNHIVCRHGHTAMAHLHIKFDDHTLNRFRVIAKNVPIPFKHEYRRPSLSSLCDVIRDVISIRNIFTHNLHMVFPFMMFNWGYTEQVKKIEKWRNFEVGANFFVKSVIRRKLS